MILKLNLILIFAIFLSLNTYANSLEKIGALVFEQSIDDVSPLLSKVNYPSIDLVFENTKNSWKFYDCHASFEDLVTLYNDTQSSGALKLLNDDRNIAGREQARKFLVGFFVCLDQAKNLSIDSPSEKFEKLKERVYSINFPDSSFSIISYKDREYFYKELTWRIIVDLLFSQAKDKDIHNPYRRASMTLSFIYHHFSSTDFKEDREWLARIYVSALIGYLDLLPPARGFDKEIFLSELRRGFKLGIEYKQFEQIRKLLAVGQFNNFIETRDVKEMATELYFSEKGSSKESNISVLLEQAVVFFRTTSVLTISALMLVYIFGVVVYSRKRNGFFLKSFFFPVLFYFDEQENGSVIKILHSVFIFLSLLLLSSWQSSIDDSIVRNMIWIGF